MHFTYFRLEPRRRHARSPRSSASRGGSAPSARPGPVRSQNVLQRRRNSGPSRRSDVPMFRKACPEGRPRKSEDPAVRVARVETGRALRHFWRRAQHGWPAGFPVVQFPNAPLLVALGGWLVAALTDGSAHAYARATFYGGLAAWAWIELDDGTNWFRRALGAGGLVYVVMKVGVALGA